MPGEKVTVKPRIYLAHTYIDISGIEIGKFKTEAHSMKRNPEQTKENILNVATTLFSKKGYHGTSLQDILSIVKVSKRMIYHYFDSKENLYFSVFEAQFESFKIVLDEKLKQVLIEEQSKNPAIIIENLFSIFFDLLSTNPNFVRLLLWTEIEDQKISTGVWENVSKDIFQNIYKLLLNVLDDKKYDLPVDIEFLILNLYGMASSFFLQSRVVTNILKEDSINEKIIKKQKETLVYFIRKIFNTNSVNC